MRTDKYTDKQGVERYSTDIVASEMQMLGGGDGKQDGAPKQQRRAPSQAPAGDASGGFPDDDDIPFAPIPLRQLW